jgi:type IV pilus assembly protein PilN
MIRINLLPVRAAQKKEKLRGQLSVLALSLIAVVLACAAVYFQVNSQINDEQTAIAQKKEQINALQKKIGEVGRFKKLQEELRGKLEVLDKLKQGRTGPVRYLDELNKVLPEKLWLTSFEEKGGNVSLKGVALNEKIVAEFMRNMGDSAFFENINLVQTAQKVDQGLKLQEFSLTCRVRLPKMGS